ncbi:hypothetical protein AB834_03985 [PVC group bacterium (ex Bugula neritina AB1)]|nr:hypothetical protein AB834_03985 [PVC group bacterium (ex Bugula neritina AB1)]
MNQICVDIGNTSTGFAFMDKENVVAMFFCQTGDWGNVSKELTGFLGRRRPLLNLYLSSVAPKAKVSLEKYLITEGWKFSVFEVNLNDKKQIHLAYAENDKSSLGTDRLSLIYKAMMNHPERNVLIVDLGTTMTVDIIKKGEHLGGFITLGVKASLEALSLKTEKLPAIVDLLGDDSFLGKSTQECIAKGIVYEKVIFLQGVLNYIQDLSSEEPFVLWGTGGDIYLLQNDFEWDKCEKKLIFEAIYEWFCPKKNE